MSIKYFPNRVYKAAAPAIDRVMAKRQPKLVRGHANVASTALDVVISSNGDWHVNAIKFTFNSSVSRRYTVSILGGVKVLQNLNDYLWFQTPDALWQKITLTPNFYTGTQLATELQTQLNANPAYVALNKTFTVAYDPATGLFVITPSAGTIRYIQQNNTQRLPDRDSIAGHLFGLTTDGSFAANVTSNTTVYGLNQEAAIIKETTVTVTQDYSDDIHILSLDQALHVVTNTATVEVDYEIEYEEIV